MAERYIKKNTLDSMLYADGAPIIICAGALLDDSLTKKRLVQLKFKSISAQAIKAVRVSVLPIRADNSAAQAVEYLYADVNAERDGEFGQKSAIVLTDGSAATFKPTVTEVIYADGTSWDGTGSVWAALKPRQSLSNALGGDEVAHQYAIRYGSDCVMLPDADRGLWYCTCGAINLESEEKCHSCRRIYSALKNINLASLKSESAQRVQTEIKQDMEEQAEKKKGRKKLIIALAILVPLLLVAAAAACTVPRYIQEKEDYAAAVALYEGGKYDAAEEAFRALGDYADSAEYAERKAPYAQAMYIMDCAARDDVEGLLSLGLKRSDVADGETVSIALYREAGKLFDALGDYKDSAAQSAAANAAIADYYDEQSRAEYEAAGALLEEGRYLSARDAFEAMGAYRDSADMAIECMYQRAVRLYEFIDKYYMQGVFITLSDTAEEKSIVYIPQSAFATLGSGVSGEIRDILNGDGVEVKLEDAPESGCEAICEAVSAQFVALGDYKDSADMAAKALEAGDFTRPFYEKCADGDLFGAYQWLTEYTGDFDNREGWLALLQGYAIYCGSWELYRGDPTLIAQTVGMDAKCGAFTSKVIIADSTAKLMIYPENAPDYPIELSAAIGSTAFTASPDGVNTFYAIITNYGRFTYTKYDSLGLQVGNYSCEYSSAG